MNTEIFITCAVTGAGDTTSKSDLVPVTPKEIAESAIEAAKAGADAVLAASVFHQSELSIAEVKTALSDADVEVRL